MKIKKMKNREKLLQKKEKDWRKKKGKKNCKKN
jgi:hypothetical protein